MKGNRHQGKHIQNPKPQILYRFRLLWIAERNGQLVAFRENCLRFHH